MNTRKFMIIGGKTELIAPVCRMNTDLVCLDLEDTVPTHLRERTRHAVPDLVARSKQNGKASSVRISAISAEDGLVDLLLLQQLAEAPDIVVLSKTDHPQEVRLVQQLLAPKHPRVRIQAIIETASALLHVEEIAALPGLHSISLGGKDLSESLRVSRSWDSLLYARGRCAAAAAAAGIPIVDGPQPPNEDPEAVRNLCERLKDLGFSGKSAICEEHLTIAADVWKR